MAALARTTTGLGDLSRDPAYWHTFIAWPAVAGDGDRAAMSTLSTADDVLPCLVEQHQFEKDGNPDPMFGMYACDTPWRETGQSVQWSAKNAGALSDEDQSQVLNIKMTDDVGLALKRAA